MGGKWKSSFTLVEGAICTVCSGSLVAQYESRWLPERGSRCQVKGGDGRPLSVRTRRGHAAARWLGGWVVPTTRSSWAVAARGLISATRTARQHWPGKVVSSAWRPAGIVVYSCSVLFSYSQKSCTSLPSRRSSSKRKTTCTCFLPLLFSGDATPAAPTPEVVPSSLGLGAAWDLLLRAASEAIVVLWVRTVFWSSIISSCWERTRVVSTERRSSAADPIVIRYEKSVLSMRIPTTAAKASLTASRLNLPVGDGGGERRRRSMVGVSPSKLGVQGVPCTRPCGGLSSLPSEALRRELKSDGVPKGTDCIFKQARCAGTAAGRCSNYAVVVNCMPKHHEGQDSETWA